MSLHTPNLTPRTKRPRLDASNKENRPIQPATPATPTPSSGNTQDLILRRLKDSNPFSRKAILANGYKKSPKTTNYTPYSLSGRGQPRRKAYSTPVAYKVEARDGLDREGWNLLAIQEGLLNEGQTLRDFQIEGANTVLRRKQDLCVIAPTGAGKSMLWVLPLLAQEAGISLVVIPFTSLGFQGENRHKYSTIPCTFLHGGSYTDTSLQQLASERSRRVIYACPEMLESPAAAPLLNSPSFRAMVSGVYLDEAHSVHESITWRPSYSRIHLLRKVLGPEIPLITISATLPPAYQKSLELYAGLSANYHLINLGNTRPELSMIVAKMNHPTNSFRDLDFLIPFNACINSLLSSLVYADDIDLLTEMFWSLRARLSSLGLPEYLVDIIHAGLSEESQKITIEEFSSGRTKILLGSDKIGAGMDFPNVRLVVQYGCRGLTLVKWEQRRGRGARRAGMTAVGVLMVEKSMGSDADAPTIDSPGAEDLGLVDLITTTSCQEACTGKHLGNPLIDNPLPCLRCSNCNPDLALATQFTFIQEDITRMQHSTSRGAGLTSGEVDRIYEKLLDWRSQMWENEWKFEWVRYSSQDLITDANLRILAQHSRSLTEIDDIYAVVNIPRLRRLAPSILTALETILQAMN